MRNLFASKNPSITNFMTFGASAPDQNSVTRAQNSKCPKKNGLMNFDTKEY